MEKCKLVVGGYLNYIEVLVQEVEVFENGILSVDQVLVNGVELSVEEYRNVKGDVVGLVLREILGVLV